MKNGYTTNYIEEGQGQPVILIHGVAASLCDWNQLIPQLTARGYHTYALDLLGHGDSSKPEDAQQYNIENIYAHFSAWVESLHLKQAPLLVGHSLGGYLSLLHALRQPQNVRGMALIDPFYSPRQLSPLLRLARRRPELGEKAVRAVPEWVIHTALGWDQEMGAHFSPQARQQVAADYKRASPHFVYITRDIPDLTPILPQVDSPALVMWGEKDQTLHPSSFPRMVQALPRVMSYRVVGSGHQPHIAKPRLVGDVTLQFFSGLN